MAATQLSGYRLMWIFVMFDLPVMTREQARAATKFLAVAKPRVDRKLALFEAFVQQEFAEQFEAYMRRIEASLPDRGDIHILTFTDRQYENIVRFSGQRRNRQRKNPDQLALF